MSRYETSAVRCIRCGHEYEPVARDGEVTCPSCGAGAWISASIPFVPIEPRDDRSATRTV